MKAVLNDLLDGKRLSVEESRLIMIQAVSEPVNSAQLSALLAVLRTRGVTPDELDGFVLALRSMAVPLDLGSNDLIDVCGTGGDHKSTFNVSTAVAFVLAGAGLKVAKHGNYAVSSSCGSSNVLEALGVRFTANQDTLRRSLDYAGVCFLHAPLFHPALKAVAPIRRDLGVRTVFNLMGPLLNPADPASQLSGVYELEALRLYGHVLGRRGVRFGAVFSLDGYDEVSLTAPARVVWRDGTREFKPESFGLKTIDPQELRGGSSIQECVDLLVKALEGRASEAIESVVIANAALALWCNGDGKLELAECVECARESLQSGSAYRALKRSTEG